MTKEQFPEIDIEVFRIVKVSPDAFAIATSHFNNQPVLNLEQMRLVLAWLIEHVPRDVSLP